GHEPEGIERENVLRGLNFLRRVHRDLRVYEDGVFSGVELDYHPGEIIEAFANLAYRNKRISKEQAIQQALLDMRHYVNRLKKAIEIGFWEKEPATAATQNENFRISSLLYLSYAQASVNATKDLLYKHTHTGLAGIQIRALEACPRSQLI
ncbi:MAG: hypothetical protein Q7R44_00035, partial [bacterium]|nr:hypothetical protein [bacterium]